MKKRVAVVTACGEVRVAYFHVSRKYLRLLLYPSQLRLMHRLLAHVHLGYQIAVLYTHSPRYRPETSTMVESWIPSP